MNTETRTGRIIISNNLILMGKIIVIAEGQCPDKSWKEETRQRKDNIKDRCV